jgi:hypothetical protein
VTVHRQIGVDDHVLGRHGVAVEHRHAEADRDRAAALAVELRGALAHVVEEGLGERLRLTSSDVGSSKANSSAPRRATASVRASRWSGRPVAHDRDVHLHAHGAAGSGDVALVALDEAGGLVLQRLPAPLRRAGQMRSNSVLTTVKRPSPSFA